MHCLQVITLMQTIVIGFVLAAICSQIELNQTGIQDETGWCLLAQGHTTSQSGSQATRKCCCLDVGSSDMSMPQVHCCLAEGMAAPLGIRLLLQWQGSALCMTLAERPHTVASGHAISGVLFFCTMFAAMTSMFGALNSFPSEAGIINRQAGCSGT